MGISTLGTRDKVISFFSNFLRIFSLSSKMRLRFFAGIIVLLASFVAGMADNDDHAIDANMVREEDAGRNDLNEEADVKEANDMTVDEAEPLDRADDDDEEEEEEVEADDVGSEEKPCNRFFTRKNYPCKDGLRYGCHWTKCWRQAKSRSNQWCYTTPIGKYSVCKTHADCADTISHDCSTPKVHGFNSVKVENMDCGDKYFKKHHCRGGVRYGYGSWGKCWRQYKKSSMRWCWTKNAEGKTSTCHDQGDDECARQNVDKQECYGLALLGRKELRN